MVPVADALEVVEVGNASDTTGFTWLSLLVGASFLFDTFLPGSGLLDGLFLACWDSVVVTVRDREQSSRFRDAGRSSPPLFEKTLRCMNVNGCALMHRRVSELVGQTGN